MRHRFFLIFFATTLGGCSITPGMRMGQVPITGHSMHAAREIVPNFIPIDVALVDSMRNSREFYRIGPQDVLEINVWRHPEFNLPYGPEVTLRQAVEQSLNENNVSVANIPVIPVGYLVNPLGQIFFPLIGNISVAGKTAEQIRQQMSQLLKKYIRSPQINIRVTAFRSQKIYIMGEVLKPGLFPITDSPISITDLINMAGGLDPNTADSSHIFVIRGDYACPNVFWLNARSPNALLLAEQFKLHSHDIVFVSSTDVARWNRVISQILPTVQTIWYTAATTNTR